MATGKRKHSSWILIGLLALALVLWFGLGFIGGRIGA